MTKVLTPTQIADRWGCSLGVVRNLIHSGQLAAFRVGKLLRIPEEAVIQFEKKK